MPIVLGEFHTTDSEIVRDAMRPQNSSIMEDAYMLIPRQPMIGRLRICAFSNLLFPCLFLLIIPHVAAATPCDFKGVSVGDKTTPESLMKMFGVKNYKMNPKQPPFKETLKLAKKYSFMAAGEIQDWNAGPVCTDNSCRIPYGVSVGDDNTPVSVFISFPGGRISEIDVTFNQAYWDEIRPIIDKKYGKNWRVDQDPYFVITDKETKKSFTVKRIILTHRSNGTNPKTGDICQIWATNYDMVYTHHDPVGTFHSVFVMKRVSNNF